MAASAITNTENRLLESIDRGDTSAFERFHSLINPWILGIANRVAPDMPEDIRREIAQQTFTNLLVLETGSFQPRRGSARQFLIGQILNAEKQVRASYGYRERRRRKDTEAIESNRVLHTLSLDEVPENVFVTPATAHVSRLYVRTILRRAPAALCHALQLVSIEGVSKEEAAKRAGLSRFQMHRQISSLRDRMRADR